MDRFVVRLPKEEAQRLREVARERGSIQDTLREELEPLLNSRTTVRTQIRAWVLSDRIEWYEEHVAAILTDIEFTKQILELAQGTVTRTLLTRDLTKSEDKLAKLRAKLDELHAEHQSLNATRKPPRYTAMPALFFPITLAATPNLTPQALFPYLIAGAIILWAAYKFHKPTHRLLEPLMSRIRGQDAPDLSLGEPQGGINERELRQRFHTDPIMFRNYVQDYLDEDGGFERARVATEQETFTTTNQRLIEARHDAIRANLTAVDEEHVDPNDPDERPRPTRVPVHLLIITETQLNRIPPDLRRDMLSRTLRTQVALAQAEATPTSNGNGGAYKTQGTLRIPVGFTPPEMSEDLPEPKSAKKPRKGGN